MVLALVLLCHNYLQCGLLDLQSPAGKKKCFFNAGDVLLGRTQRKGEDMSQWLKKGTKLRVNARKVSDKKEVPFIATTVWAESEGRRVTEGMKNKVFQDIPRQVMEKYSRTSADILSQYKGGPRESSSSR